jgi:hypothetical protein
MLKAERLIFPILTEDDALDILNLMQSAARRTPL